MSEAKTARTYNQDHAPRKYARGRRRVSVYIAWSYPGEANRDPTVLDNRFSTMTEVRRVFWPAYEAPQWADPSRFQQGIAGSLELFFWAWVKFQRRRRRGHRARGPDVPARRPGGLRAPARRARSRRHRHAVRLRSRSPGHRAGAAPEEIEAVREFLEREGTCLVIGPHHDVGRSDGHEGTRHGVPAPRRRAGAAAATVRRVHALA